MFGMSFIYIIFEDNVEFYWSRSRILEKLNSLSTVTLPHAFINSGKYALNFREHNPKAITIIVVEK